MSVSEVFQRISSALDRAGIAYMLTGSFASAHYGVLRSAQDIANKIHHHKTRTTVNFDFQDAFLRDDEPTTEKRACSPG